MSSNLNDIWVCGDLGKKRKFKIWYFHPVWVTTSQMEKFEP